MVWQLALSAVLIATTVVIHVGFIGVAFAAAGRVRPWLARPPGPLKIAIGLAAATLWMTAAHGLAIWLWAFAFLLVGDLPDLETALYFASVCFTTLGFGDIVPAMRWRMLAGLCAANGLLAFGVSAAFLVELLRDFRDAMIEG